MSQITDSKKSEIQNRATVSQVTVRAHLYAVIWRIRILVARHMKKLQLLSIFKQTLFQFNVSKIWQSQYFHLRDTQNIQNLYEEWIFATNVSFQISNEVDVAER